MTNVAEIAVRFGLVDHTLTSNLILHVHAADSRAPFDDDDRLAIGLATADWWNSDGASYGKVSSAYPSEITLDEIVVKNVEPSLSADTVVDGEATAGTYIDIPGTTKRFMHPPQVCALVGLRTLVDTRRGRGRIYFPAHFDVTYLSTTFPDPDDITLGQLQAGDQMDYAHVASRIAEAYYNAVGFDPGEIVLAVYSKLDHDAYSVTHFAVATHYRTQRRRALHPAGHGVYGLDGNPA